MARRSSEEMRAEFDRLWEIFDLIFEYQLSKLSHDEAERHRTWVPTRKGMLEKIGREGTTMSDLVEGIRQSINDFEEIMDEYVETGHPSYASEFFAFYKSRTGRDFYDDAGNPKKTARKILKRGNIDNDTEFYLLMNIVNNVEQTMFKDNELQRVNDLLHRFEQRASR